MQQMQPLESSTISGGVEEEEAGEEEEVAAPAGVPRSSYAGLPSTRRIRPAWPAAMSSASTFTSDMSFTMRPTRRPLRLLRMCCRSVVFPAPRNPERRVTGRRGEDDEEDEAGASLEGVGLEEEEEEDDEELLAML